jgi:hypothetical protein
VETGPTASSPTITSSPSDAITQGVPDNFTVTTNGTPTPSLSESGALPAGITFTDDGNGTASIAGTTSQSGAYILSITAANGVTPNDTQSFALTVNPPVTTWTQQSPGTSPGNLIAPAMAFDPATGQQLLFGGSPSANNYTNGTWTWNGTTWTLLSPATSPPARADASMAYDAATGQVLLFGGTGAGATYLNDTWAWDGTTWTQLTPATSPPVRSNASMAYDPVTSQLLLFGGAGNTTTTGGDTWTWNGSTWSQLTPATSPASRSRSMMAYDSATSQLLLFGGSTSGTSTVLGDTWTWSGMTWSQLKPAISPPARGSAAFNFDVATQQLVLFGGFVSGTSPLGDTWDWTGTTWTKLAPIASPSARFRTASAYDAASSKFLLYGGSTNGSTLLGETWTYAPVPATVPGEPTIGAATGGNAQATVAFSPPSTNNGSPVISYRVTATDLTTPANGGQTASGPGSPLTVTGLTNGDSYTFTVTATNIVGTGASSLHSNAVNPATVPGAPTIGTATGGNARATISFSPPASDGGAAIRSYTVAAKDLTTPGNSGRTASGPGSPLTVTGLTNGDSYTFTVTATNSVGTGPASGASNTVAPFAIISVAPGHLAQGAVEATVVIHGIGFSSPVGVVVSGGGVTPTLVSVTPTIVAITADVSPMATLGARDVTVSDTNGSVTCTACLAITPAPTLTGANPSHLAVGATGSVSFLGSGLQTGATVMVTGPSTTVTVVASSIVATGSTLTATVKVAAGTATGAYSVNVTNPDNSTATCANCLTVMAAPTLVSFSPSTVTRGTTTPVTINGTGFATGAKVTGPTGVTFTKLKVVGSTTITGTMAVSATATTGTKLGITVANSATAGYGKVSKGLLNVK